MSEGEVTWPVDDCGCGSCPVCIPCAACVGSAGGGVASGCKGGATGLGGSTCRMGRCGKSIELICSASSRGLLLTTGVVAGGKACSFSGSLGAGSLTTGFVSGGTGLARLLNWIGETSVPLTGLDGISQPAQNETKMHDTSARMLHGRVTAPLVLPTSASG